MTNDEKKTLLQQRYAELDDESLCALERHKLTEQARELFDAELARRGLDLPLAKRAPRRQPALSRRPCASVNGAVWVSRPSLPVSSLPGPPWSGSSMATVWTPWRPCPWLPAAWPWSSSCWPLPCAADEAPAPAGQISPRLRSCQAISRPAAPGSLSVSSCHRLLSVRAQTSAHYDSFPSFKKREMPYEAFPRYVVLKKMWTGWSSLTWGVVPGATIFRAWRQISRFCGSLRCPKLVCPHGHSSSRASCRVSTASCH